MSIRVTNLRLEIEEDEVLLPQKIAKRLKVSREVIRSFSIIKKSIDARKNTINFVYSVDVELSANEAQTINNFKKDPTVSKVEGLSTPRIQLGSKKLTGHPIIVGAGPAGIFAALTMASYGYKPLLLERGSQVEIRTTDIKSFWETGELKLNSNIQFGEGGAGTFSDGKLTTRINDYRIRQVLESFVEAGAPEDILYLNKPHLGTDKLREIVVNLREKIISLGGSVRFNAHVTGFLTERNKITGVIVNKNEEIYSNVVILAIGHSARDTYQTLFDIGARMEAKALAIGARIEHPQRLIDQAQYGKFLGHPKLGAADYQLVYNSKEHERAAYTFCMCPGGVVVGASSEEKGVVTNGMSEYKRDSGIANSALVVSVTPEDFDSKHVLAGIEFQRQWEKKAYTIGQGGYKAPSQKVSDFLAGKPSKRDDDFTLSTYQPGVVAGNLHDCLPSFVSEMMEEAIEDFGKRLKNFNLPEAILTGVETRTSSPVRVLRDNSYQAVELEGLYPAGEGAGYAGGITSAAVDGIKVSESVIGRFGKGEY